jgi:hypothetical protein
MTDAPAPSAARRWRFALATFAAVLALFVASLAPTVTLWDAGEFLAASRILGIPHPPGTPFWVMLAHVWGTLVPIGEWAYRINLMTAVASAVAAACFGLVAWEGLRRVPALGGETPSWFAQVGAGVAAIAGAFTYTNWQNSLEAEVYGIAMLVIGVVIWSLLRWREQRGTPAADRTLLFILYLAGLSIGNHLLALLAGPAVVAFLWLVAREAPLKDPAERSKELATVAVMGGTWFLLIGLGLGSTWISVIGGLAFAVATAWALTHRRGGFAAVALVVSLIGITTYLFMFIRAGQHPMLNEAQPDNWQALLDVIRRKQYPPRGPLDDPTIGHGPGNPGRSLYIMGLQVLNYLQYFTWQWGMGLGRLILKVPFVMLYFILGFVGTVAHRRGDRAAWGMLLVLFLTTGIGLMGYMNFKPGNSLGYERYPNFADHEVRERDYFFVVSFVVWGLWAGMGLTLLARKAWGAVATRLRPLAAGAVLALGLIPVATNWAEASRARMPVARVASDFAYDLLNSVPPYGILVTFGDNDTFPLWWAQEVEGIRPDVTIFCLALAQTEWYLRQLRDQPVRPFSDSGAAPLWRGTAGARPEWPTHSMTDQEILGFSGRLTEIPQTMAIPLGTIQHLIPAGTVLAPNDIALLRVIQTNLGRRSIAWSVSAGRNFLGLDPYIVQQGMVYTLLPERPDSTDPRYTPREMGGLPVDVPATTRMVEQVYRFAGMDSIPDRGPMDPAAEGVASNLANPVILLAVASDAVGDDANAIRYVEMALRIRPDAALRNAAAQIRQRAMLRSRADSAPLGDRPGVPTPLP